MNERIETWIKSQQAMVGPDSVCVTRIVLVGPEGDSWGTWPLEMENIATEIDATIITQGEGRGSGVYACKLLGLDRTGGQLALLPIRVTGHQPNLVGTGAEANALQRATGVAVSSLEQVIMGQGNQIAKALETIESLMEDRTILLEEFNKQAAQNLDVELRRLEWERRVKREDEVFELFKEVVAPSLAGLANAWAERQEEDRKERKRLAEQQQAKFPPGWPDPSEISGRTEPPATPPPAEPPPTPPAAPPAPTASDDPSTPAEPPAGALAVRASGFAGQPTNQMGAPPIPGERLPPATPARATRPESPSAILPSSDAENEQPADLPSPAGPHESRGAEAASKGSGPRKRRRRAQPDRAKPPKRSAPAASKRPTTGSGS